MRMLAGMAAAAAAVLVVAAGVAAGEPGDSTRPQETRPGVTVSPPTRAHESLTMNALLGFINSEPVFVHDMLRPVDESLRDIARDSKGDEATFRSMAKDLVESQLKSYVSDILIITNAKASLTDEDKGKLDLYMNMEKSKLISKYGGSEPLANQALKAEGSSVDKALKDIRRRVTVDLYLNKTLFTRIVITRDMVLNGYQKSPERWREPAEIELYTITLPVSRMLPKEAGANGVMGNPIPNPTADQIVAAQAATMAQARDLIEKLKKGANFAQMVEDCQSHDEAADKGGRTPHVLKGSMRNEKLADYAFSLPANTVGNDPQIVKGSDQTGLSVVIVKVGEKKESRTIPFAEAQKKIEQELRETQSHKLYQDYITQLYKAAAIERVDRMADVALDVAVARYLQPGQ